VSVDVLTYTKRLWSLTNCMWESHQIYN